MVTELIADDGLWTDTPATNFITVNIKPDSDEDPDPSRLAGRVARAFLGVRIDCAECHDCCSPHRNCRDDCDGMCVCC